MMYMQLLWGALRNNIRQATQRYKIPVLCLLLLCRNNIRQATSFCFCVAQYSSCYSSDTRAEDTRQVDPANAARSHVFSPRRVCPEETGEQASMTEAVSKSKKQREGLVRVVRLLEGDLDQGVLFGRRAEAWTPEDCPPRRGQCSPSPGPWAPLGWSRQQHCCTTHGRSHPASREIPLATSQWLRWINGCHGRRCSASLSLSLSLPLPLSLSLSLSFSASQLISPPLPSAPLKSPLFKFFTTPGWSNLNRGQISEMLRSLAFISFGHAGGGGFYIWNTSPRPW